MEPKKKRKTNPNKLYLPQAKKIVSKEIIELGLNDKEIKFVAAYISNGMDKEDAYYKAGFESGKRKSVAAQSNLVLNRPRVVEALRLFLDDALRPYKEKLEFMIMSIVYKRAFYSLSKFFDEDGIPLRLDQIPEEDQVCIDSIEYKFIGSGQNQEKVLVYKMANRSENIRTLMELLNKYDNAGDSSDSNFTNKKREEIKSIFENKENSFSKSVFDKYGLKDDKHFNKIVNINGN